MLLANIDDKIKLARIDRRPGQRLPCRPPPHLARVVLRPGNRFVLDAELRLDDLLRYAGRPRDIRARHSAFRDLYPHGQQADRVRRIMSITDHMACSPVSFAAA